MDPDNFSLIIDLDDDSDYSDDEDMDFVTAARLESELVTLRANLAGSHRELENLKIQETFFDPRFPPALGYVEEVNEKDLKGSIRACEYRIRRLTAQISNLNRKVVSAKRAEELGKNVGLVLNIEERTLFVLGMGNDHCHPQVIRTVFKVFGDIEQIEMHKRHCLVTFTSKQGATKALSMNGSKPLGRRLRVRPKLEPYAFSSMPLTLSWVEPPTFSFKFTFCVPRVPLPPANYHPPLVCA